MAKTARRTPPRRAPTQTRSLKQDKRIQAAKGPPVVMPSLSLRAFWVMFLTATIAGPLNFTLGFLALVLFNLPANATAPTILVQSIIAALTIIACGLIIGRFTALPRFWGYLLGTLIAIATNPLVLLSFASG